MGLLCVAGKPSSFRFTGTDHPHSSAFLFVVPGSFLSSHHLNGFLLDHVLVFFIAQRLQSPKAGTGSCKGWGFGETGTSSWSFSPQPGRGAEDVHMRLAFWEEQCRVLPVCPEHAAARPASLWGACSSGEPVLPVPWFPSAACGPACGCWRPTRSPLAQAPCFSLNSHSAREEPVGPSQPESGSSNEVS